MIPSIIGVAGSCNPICHGSAASQKIILENICFLNIFSKLSKNGFEPLTQGFSVLCSTPELLERKKFC